MEFSRRECWTGLPFPSPVDHILSELSTMTCLSWVALQGMAHSFIGLDKAVVHVIRLVSFLWLWFLSVCPLMPSLSTCHLTGVSLTLDGVYPLMPQFLTLDVGYLLSAMCRFSAVQPQGYGFSSGHVWMWELDYKESWMPKNWCFWTVVLEKTFESPLDCKEIQLVHPKGDQSWVFIGRTDVEAETPILWTPDEKNWLIWKDPGAGKDWRQEEKGTTEDEMVGWHHRFNGHEFG